MRTKTLIGILLASGLAAGCGGLPRISWPWAKPPAAAPQPVDELTFASGATAPIAQFWQGNTLVLDLTGVPATGTAVVTATYARGWPMRIVARSLPGRFGALEARGAQRAVLPLTTEGTGTVDLAIPPEVYPPGTPQIGFSWGTSITPAVVFPQAPTPQATIPQPSPTS